MVVSENSGTPKSSILIGFSIINHPFWGSSIFGNTHMIAIPTSRSWDVPSEALWRWFGPREDQDHCTLACEKYRWLVVGSWGLVVVGGFGVECWWCWWWCCWMFLVLFCYVCVFVCTWYQKLSYVYQKTVLVFLCFAWTLLFPATFYTLNQRIDTQCFMFYILCWLQFGCVYPVEFTWSHCIHILQISNHPSLWWLQEKAVKKGTRCWAAGHC